MKPTVCQIFIARFIRVGMFALLCGSVSGCSYVMVMVQPASTTVEPGGSAEFVVSVSRVGDIANVDLSIPPQADMNATFTPARLDPSQDTTKLTVTSATTATIGPRSLEIQTVPPARSNRLDGRPTTANVVVGPCGARWVRQFGTNENDNIAIRLDSASNAYVSVGLDRAALVAKLLADGDTDWHMPSPFRTASGHEAGGRVQADGTIFLWAQYGRATASMCG